MGREPDFVTELIDVTPLLEMMESLHRTRDPELILLRSHLTIERLLVAAVTARLHIEPTDTVPRISFRALVELATYDATERKHLGWFNELRNSIAHEFDALDSNEFRNLIACFGVPWPDGVMERSIVIERIAYRLFLLTFARYLDWFSDADPTDPDESKALAQAERGANQLREQSRFMEAQFDLMRDGQWDVLTKTLRGGWRPRRVESPPDR